MELLQQNHVDFDAAVRTMPLPQLVSMIGEEQFIKYVQELPGDEVEALIYDWHSWARPEQLEPPGTWSIWLILAGRGYGKTRTGSEWIKERVASGKARRIALVSQSAADARDVLVEGEAGILAIYPDGEKPNYSPSKRRITWPNGAVATIYTAEDPDQLRGPSHDTALADEIAAYRNLDDVWSNLMFGLRLGDARCLATTTPKPLPKIKELVKAAKDPNDGSVYITHGTTYDNIGNLSNTYKTQIIKPYEGTRVGRQELNAELLEDIEGALWTLGGIEKNRWKRKKLPPLTKIIVAVDPSAGSAESAAETGIIVAGMDKDKHGYCLEDLTMRGTPLQWATVVCDAYRRWNANLVIAEKNNGGEMVEHTIASAVEKRERIPVKLVWASRGKLIRAEPVSSLDEKGEIHMVGLYPQLEDELCTYEGSGDSPNRLDAYVWAFTHLLVKKMWQRGGTFGKRRARRNQTIN